MARSSRCRAVAKAIIEAPRSAPGRHGLAVALTDADPLDPPGCWSLMYEATRWYGRHGAVLHAMSGVDQALWDIVGKATGKPVSEIWGKKRDRVRADRQYAVSGLPERSRSDDEALSRYGVYGGQFGYGSFGGDRKHDHALLDAITAAASGAADIMVDAGRVWSTCEGIERSRDLFDSYPITWLEEPVREDNLDGYQHIAAAVSGRLAGGETEAALGSFEELLRRGVKVLQPDVGRAGGLTVCREISRCAMRAGAWCVPHCFGTSVNLAASLQWMASAEEAPFIEFPLTASELRNTLVVPAPTRVGAWAIVPDGPGLGVGIDEDVLRRYRQA